MSFDDFTVALVVVIPYSDGIVFGTGDYFLIGMSEDYSVDFLGMSNQLYSVVFVFVKNVEYLISTY